MAFLCTSATPLIFHRPHMHIILCRFPSCAAAALSLLLCTTVTGNSELLGVLKQVEYDVWLLKQLLSSHVLASGRVDGGDAGDWTQVVSSQRAWDMANDIDNDVDPFADA